MIQSKEEEIMNYYTTSEILPAILGAFIGVFMLVLVVCLLLGILSIIGH